MDATIIYYRCQLREQSPNSGFAGALDRWGAFFWNLPRDRAGIAVQEQNRSGAGGQPFAGKGFQIAQSNKTLEPNRRPASPLNVERHLGHSFCAPPFFSGGGRSALCWTA